MIVSYLSLVALVWVPSVWCKPNFNYLTSFIAEPDATTPEAQYIKMPVDHNDSTVGTFRNRWWFNDTYYQPGGPVVVFDMGENDAEIFVASYLQPGHGAASAVMALAQKYHGIGVVWEHRYFGASIPFVEDYSYESVAALTAAEWSYLTFEQALEDVVFFANHFSLPPNTTAARKLQSSDALQASQTPWIFIGGSYSGVRGSTLRIRNPEIIYAAWASSAPVQLQVGFPSYFRTIARGLPQNCSADLAAATRFYDDALSGNDTEVKRTVQHNVHALNRYDPNFADPTLPDHFDIVAGGRSLALAAVGAFQGGGLEAVQPFCDAFETNNGHISTSSVGHAVSNVTGSQIFSWLIEAMVGSEIISTTNDTDPYTGRPPLPYELSWAWLYCSELGYFQITDPNDSTSIISQAVTLNAIQAQCNAMFPDMLPSSPPVDVINNKYGGWKQNPSRVMYTNGELDPWRTLSVASIEDDAPMRIPTSTIPPADGVPENGTYYGTIYLGQVHAADLYSSPSITDTRNKAFEDGLNMFTAALDQWMSELMCSSPCPVAESNTNTSFTGGSAK